MKKSISVMALIMVVIVLCCSCAVTPDGKSNDTTKPFSTGGDTQTTAVTDTEPSLYDDIPTDKYDGHEFKMLVVSHGWAIYAMDVDNTSGDVVESAIFSRNSKVEELLDVEFVQEETDAKQVVTSIKNQHTGNLTGKDAYDMFTTACSNISSSINYGCLYNLQAVPEINPEKPWWYTSFNNSINLGDYTYIMAGDLSNVYYCAFGLCAFNKELLEIVSPGEDLYKVYNSEEWTWEKCFH